MVLLTAAAGWGCAAEAGMRPALELVHMFLQQPQWNEAAMGRAKQSFLAHYRSLSMSLDRGCSDRMLALMLGPDRWAGHLPRPFPGQAGPRYNDDASCNSVTVMLLCRC